MKLSILLLESNKLTQFRKAAEAIALDLGVNQYELLQLALMIDPTDRKNLTLWILRAIKEVGVDNAINRIPPVIYAFQRLREVIPQKDINTYKSFAELEETIRQYQNVATKGQGGTGNNLANYPGISLFKSIGDVELYQISDPKSLSEVTEGTKLCVRKSYPRCAAEEYIQRYGAIYLLLNKGVMKAIIGPDYYPEIKDRNNIDYWSQDENELSLIAHISNKLKSYIIKSYLRGSDPDLHPDGIDPAYIIPNIKTRENSSSHTTVANGVITTTILEPIRVYDRVPLNTDDPKIVKLRKILEPMDEIPPYHFITNPVELNINADYLSDEEIEKIRGNVIWKYKGSYVIPEVEITRKDRKLVARIFHDFSDLHIVFSFMGLPEEARMLIIKKLKSVLLDIYQANLADLSEVVMNDFWPEIPDYVTSASMPGTMVTGIHIRISNAIYLQYKYLYKKGDKIIANIERALVEDL